MKNLCFCWKFAWIGLWLALIPLNAYSAEWERNLARTYPATDFASLEIRSQGGSVQIHTSEQDQIELFVTIRARAATEEKAQEYLKQVEIRERQFGNQLQLETQELEQSLWQMGSGEGLEVIFEVFLPESHALEIRLKRGDIHLGNRGGNVNIELTGGELQADTLYGQGNRLELNRAKASLDSVGGIDVRLSFSELEIESVGELYLRSQTAKINLGSARDIDLVANLGELSFGRVENIRGSYSASQCKIETLVHSLDLEVKYAPPLEIETVAAGFSRINLNGNATGIRLGVSPAASFELEAEMAYGELEATDWQAEIEEEKTSNHARVYRKAAQSTARSDSPPGLITIDNRSGRVKLSQKTPMQY